MVQFVDPPSSIVEIVGPFRGDVYRLLVDGCRVPYVQIVKNAPQNDDEAKYEWYLILDDRFGHFANTEDIEHWGYFLANCMAVSAGYTSHGPNSLPINRHSARTIGLPGLPADE